MIYQGKIISCDNDKITVQLNADAFSLIIDKQIKTAEIRLDDGRTISAEQRRMIYATLRDISEWSGDIPERLKEIFKFNFCARYKLDYFSLSDVDMTTAREFITYLIDFCLRWDVPLSELAIYRTQDIDKYLYMCLWYRKCAITGQEGADIHHVDRVGIRSRDNISHTGMRAIALNREWHTKVHQENEQEIYEKFHIYGIKLDERLCRHLNLGKVEIS